MAASLTIVGGCSDDGDDPQGAAGGTHRIVQPGAPGEPSRVLTPDQAAELAELAAAPAHTEADVDFMQHMIHHHQQALDMTALVDERSSNPDVRLLAEGIEVAQRDEIALMERWLAERDEQPAASHGHDPLPGMLTQDEMSALAAARSAVFDRLFVELMIRHHQGAIEMVDQLFVDGGGLDVEVFQFATHVASDQSVEISRMREMLVGLADDAAG
jgi:uncharacterized protein (DUF305 family)